jgi:hypothetical protein
VLKNSAEACSQPSIQSPGELRRPDLDPAGSLDQRFEALSEVEIEFFNTLTWYMALHD